MNVPGDLHRARLLAQYAPPSVLAGRDRTIRHVMGDVQPYLQDASAGRDVVQAARTALRPALRQAFRRLFDEAEGPDVFHRRVRLGSEGSSSVDLRVERVRPEAGEDFAHVVFHPASDETGAAPGMAARIERLERELADARRELKDARQEAAEARQESAEVRREADEARQESAEARQALAEARQALAEAVEVRQALEAEVEAQRVPGETLREQEAQARERLVEIEAIYDSAPVGLCVFDAELRFVRINERLAEINGLSVEAHLGHTAREVVPDLADAVELLLRKVLETGMPVMDVELSGETVAQPGVRRTWLEHYYPLKDEAGETVGINVVAEEITERIRARERLQGLTEALEAQVAEQAEEVRRLAADLTLAEQRERHRIAQVLHDDLQQLLYAAQVQLHLMKRCTTDAERTALVEKARALQQDAITVARQLTIDLSPPVLEDEGFGAALAWMASQVQELYGLRLYLVATTPLDDLDRARGVLLFRLVRELVFNIVKHAQVDEAAVQVSREADRLSIVVADRGVGFDPEAELAPGEAGGFGLSNMEERLRHFGGTLRVASRPGTGTRIEITMPVGEA